MQQYPKIEDTESAPPDLQRMLILVTESKAAARSLYEFVPNRSAVEPLYRYLDDALREISDELVRAIAWVGRGAT